jgi:hypothetical protein
MPTMPMTNDNSLAAEVQRQAERAADKNQECFKQVNQAAIDASTFAVKTLVLINGGAAVALLAFIGALVRDDKASVSVIAATLVWFAVGVATGAGSAMVAYCTHYSTSVSTALIHDRWQYQLWRWLAVGFQMFGALLALASLVMFIIGMLAVRSALGRL